MMHPKIKTVYHDYYCGKTIDLKNRFNEHKNENKPHWFGYGNRKQWINIMVFIGDYKRARVKFIYEICSKRTGDAS